MKTKLGILIFLLAATLAHAQTNNLTALLQQGLFEEQANRNLDAAIADYQALARQFDKDRQLAATAVFRLGECYRMQGKTNEAALEYQRILRDFSDQTTLATLSRQNLTGMGMTPAPAVRLRCGKRSAGETNRPRRTGLGWIRNSSFRSANRRRLKSAPRTRGIAPATATGRNGFTTPGCRICRRRSQVPTRNFGTR